MNQRVIIEQVANLVQLSNWSDDFHDGNILTNQDPFEGVVTVNGKLVREDTLGLGVSRRSLPNNFREDYR